MRRYQDFYKNVFWGSPEEGIKEESWGVPFAKELKAFVENFCLGDKKILEIGSGAGKFQDIVPDYTGIDIVPDLKNLYHKPYISVQDGERYPFEDDSFDAIFSNAVLEHIPDIETALREMARVLKPDGVMLINVAWQARPWTAKGYTVRPYGDFDFWGKCVKVSIPLRDSVLFRLPIIIIRRILRTIKYLSRKESRNYLDYKKIKPNYEVFWTSDSDACNSIDPHAMIIWFRNYNFEVLNYPNLARAFCVRTGSLVLKKKKLQ